MKFKVTRPGSGLKALISLPVSKSISNRLLIIQALSGVQGSISNLSDSDDTRYMIDALSSIDTLKDVGHAGTSMRFLTAYYSAIPGKVILTGSERLQQRPVGPLVDALRNLGAGIICKGKEGYPPLEISGCHMQGGELEIDGGISSQFISALLMIAPTMKDGLILHLKGELVSSSYIKMTLGLMAKLGISYTWEDRTIVVRPGRYRIKDLKVESDWSAASYWYAMALLEDHSHIRLQDLEEESSQGDSALVRIFQQLGILSEFSGTDVMLNKLASITPARFSFDFTNSPDIVQSMAVALCLSNIPFHFAGTNTLRIKETDRIAALQKELGKYGFLLRSDDEGSFLSWNREYTNRETDSVIETYHDHRMAMSFAMISLKEGSVIIDDPMVVSKSYPAFWSDMEKAGFVVEELD